jgi:hypothetical protein
LVQLKIHHSSNNGNYTQSYELFTRKWFTWSWNTRKAIQN